MRKLFSFLAVLMALLVTGLAQAHELAYDPLTGLSYISVPVYNNSGGDLDAGDVVVWDISSSTGDNDAYVTTTTTADTAIVAGVIWPKTIGTGLEGSMVIWGLAECDVSSVGVVAGGPVCTASSSAGNGDQCTTVALESNKYAIANTTGSSSQISCFVNTQ